MHAFFDQKLQPRVFLGTWGGSIMLRIPVENIEPSIDMIRPRFFLERSRIAKRNCTKNRAGKKPGQDLPGPKKKMTRFNWLKNAGIGITNGQKRNPSVLAGQAAAHSTKQAFGLFPLHHHFFAVSRWNPPHTRLYFFTSTRCFCTGCNHVISKMCSAAADGYLLYCTYRYETDTPVVERNDERFFYGAHSLSSL